MKGRKLIIDGTAVYELDEDCMLKKRMEDLDRNRKEKEAKIQTGNRKRIEEN